MIDPTLSLPDDPGTVTVDGVFVGATDDAAPVSPPGFELLDEVGRGGMGVVFRARDTVLDREVAVKLLRPGIRPGSTAAARFVEEARITGQLQHPGIPAVYQVGTLPDGRPYLAMKLIKGSTLDAILSEDRDPAADRGRFVAAFEQLCQTVAYAHAHGVLHRDLKPHNVMVGAFGEVQVLDWGLAKRIRHAEVGTQDDHPPPDRAPAADSSELAPPDSVPGTGYSDLTQHGSVLGTPAYMPPEQAVGDHDRLGPPADVFGLGAILCVLLTGLPPLAGDRAESVRLAAAAGDTAVAFARLDGCGADPEVVALCKRCLAFDPADRPADAGAVAGEVSRIRAAADERLRTAEVERAGAEVRAAEQRKRRKAVLAAAAALVAALTLGVVGTAVGLVRADRRRAEAEESAAEARRLGALADRERAKAASRLDKAVEAVEKMITRAGTAHWARNPALAAERRRILEDAVAFYEGFGEADDPVVRRETARAHRRIGGAFLLLADYPTAADYLGRARAGCEALAAEFPADAGYAADLAEARLFVGHAAASSGRTADALAAYRDATAAARLAAAGRPADDDGRRTLVACLIGLGFFTMQTDPPAAAPLFREAVGEVDALLARPAVPFATRAVAAYTYASAATHDLAQGRLPEGLAKVKRAAAVHAETPPDPTVPAHYQDLFDMTGGILKMTDAAAVAAASPGRGAALFRQAAETFDALLAAYPKAFQYRLYQVMILSQEITLLTRLGRTAEAARRRAELLVAGEAIGANSPTSDTVARLLASQKSAAVVERASAGDVSDLDRQADDLLALGGDGVRYNVACALAQGSRHGPPADRERRAKRAVELLNGLLAGRFYAGPTNAAHLAKDTDLDPLRDRPDYKSFAAELTTKFPPSPTPLPKK